MREDWKMQVGDVLDRLLGAQLLPVVTLGHAVRLDDVHAEPLVHGQVGPDRRVGDVELRGIGVHEERR